MPFDHECIKSKIDSQLNQFYRRVGGETFAFVRGIDKIYEEVLKASKNIGDILEIPESYWGIEDEMKKREILLYTISSYRDHLIHQFNVFLSGYKIINLLISAFNFHPILKRSHDIDQYYNIYRIWFLTALFHDIEYTIQEIGRWLPETLKRFLGINTEEEWKAIYNNNFLDWGKFYLQNYEHLSDIREYFIDLYTNKPDNTLPSSSNLKGLFDEGVLGEPKNHATMSAIWLLRQKPPDGITKEAEQKERQARVIAGTAISLHTDATVKHIDPPICFDFLPLPFLLMFCDNLCEWGRIKIDKDEAGKGMYTSKDCPRLKDINKNNKNTVVCELKYSFEELKKSRGCQTKTGAQNYIKELVNKHVRPFQGRFMSGKEYKFEILYYLDENLIEPAKIVF